MTIPAEPTRCWPTTDPEYIRYHDEEWGVPLHDDRLLFEFLVLDGAQAGLSWITILKRRDNYRRAFNDFDPEKMAAWTDGHIETLLQDSGIIRNRAKVLSARKNARAFLQVVQETGSFDQYLWSFVVGRTKINAWKKMADIPAETAESQAMSRDLKKRGFTFVGPTICYAFMQAAGLVNDHLVDCFRYKEVGNHPGASAKKK